MTPNTFITQPRKVPTLRGFDVGQLTRDEALVLWIGDDLDEASGERLPVVEFFDVTQCRERPSDAFRA